jgi:hypothetical protein
MPTPAFDTLSRPRTGVETSLDIAGTSACATSASVEFQCVLFAPAEIGTLSVWGPRAKTPACRNIACAISQSWIDELLPEFYNFRSGPLYLTRFLLW